MLELAGRWSERGNRPDEQYWEFLAGTVELALARWPRHLGGARRAAFVRQVMCWAAARCRHRAGEEHGLPAPLRWRAAWPGRAAIETDGVDPVRGSRRCRTRPRRGVAAAPMSVSSPTATRA
ncbi:MAG: hypothetical protein U1F25_01525 [Rubrivivax sp.]